VALADVWDTFRSVAQPALMTVMRNEGRWDKSNAVFDDGVVSLYDKGRAGDAAFQFIDYGLLALTSDVVAEIPSGEFADMATLLHRLSAEGRLAGFEAHDRFYEIGTPAGLVVLEAYLAGAPPGERTHA
jgi:NDP-sugar pyrophosphorylase family protein